MPSSFKSLASYDWLRTANNPRATLIAIPGSPPLWDAKTDVMVPKDSGWVVNDHAAYHNPRYPMESLFRALLVADPDFDLGEVDVYTDRNNLRKLYFMSDPSSDAYGWTEFLIHVECRGRTAVFDRIHEGVTEEIPADTFVGFGRNYERAVCRPVVRDSTSHHRVVGYKINGLHLVVRCETDAYIPQPPGSPLCPSPVSGLSLGHHAPQPPSNQVSKPWANGSEKSSLCIHRGGQHVDNRLLLEIKTRTYRRPLPFEHTAVQLWFAQTPNLLLAYHHTGVFSATAPRNVAKELQSWGVAHRAHLLRTADLIREILRLVRANGGKADIRYQAGRLHVVKVPGNTPDFLPPDLTKRLEATA